MNLLGYFRSQRKKTASVAKERLQILVAQERANRGGHDYLPELQNDLLQENRKYVEVDQDAVQKQLDRERDCEILELNITLPEHPRQQQR